MSDTKPVPPLPQGILTEDQLAKIAGGNCTAAETTEIISNLTQTYENLVDFTSYVIERVTNSVQ